MQRIIYVPPWKDVTYMEDGVVMELAYPYIIGSPRGTGGVEVRLATAPSPLLSGVPVYNLTLADRQITFYIHIKGADRKDMYAERKRLAGLLTPFSEETWEKPGRLYYENDDGIYWIDAIPINSPSFGERIKNYNRADLTFQCPDPVFKEVTAKYAELKYGTSAFRFPFHFKPTVSFGTFGYKKELINSGQVAAPLLIKITGTGVENPTIINRRTGKYIRVVLPVPNGAALEIDTSFWNRRVEIVYPDSTTENAYHYIDLASDFFQILPGANMIDFKSDVGNENAVIDITWYNQFAGV